MALVLYNAHSSIYERMKLKKVGLLLILLGLLTGCGSKPESVEDQFKLFLNLEASTLGIDLKGSGQDRFPILLSKGYYTYRADEEVIARLLGHKKFSESSEFNQSIEKTKCTTSGFPDEFTYWTEDAVSVKGKTCFEGTYFPYVHYLIHDPANDAMQHFVTGMRD